MATNVGSRQQAGGGKKNCAEPVYCATCKTVELSPPDWTQFGGGGVCRDCDDEAAAARDARLNASGVYVRGVETIEIPLPKTSRCAAEIRMVQQLNGTWVFGYDFRRRGDGGSSAAPGRRSKPYSGRHLCLYDAIDHLVAYAKKSEWPETAIEQVERNRVSLLAAPPRNGVLSTTTPSGIAAFDPEATPRGGTLDASGLKKLPGEWHLSVDGQFQAAQRALTKLERDKLRDDLRVRGCLDPLIVWHDEGLEECGRGFPQRVRAPALLLVDGHHRYQFCAELGLPVAIQTVDLPDRAAVLNWMRDHQLGRRNLSPDERDALLAADYAAVAKPRGGKREKSKGPAASKDHSEPLTTEESRIEKREAPKSAAAAVAEKHGVSEATVKRAVRGQRAKAKLAEKAPEQAAEVKALPRAAAIARAEGKAVGSRQQAVGSRKAAISFTGANREKANDMLAAHLALFPVSARYEQSGHLLDAINAWRGQHFVGPTRNGKPRPR